MFDKGQKQSSTLSCDSSYLSFFSQFELSYFFFWYFSEWIECTLSAQLLLQFNTDTFETLQTLWPCFDDKHVVVIYSSD